MAVDPDSDLPYDYTPPSTDGSNNDDVFNRSPSLNAGRRGKLTIGVSFSLFYSKKRKDFRNYFFFIFRTTNCYYYWFCYWRSSPFWITVLFNFLPML
jgi:hypothetical protein